MKRGGLNPKPYIYKVFPFEVGSFNSMLTEQE